MSRHRQRKSPNHPADVTSPKPPVATNLARPSSLPAQKDRGQRHTVHAQMSFEGPLPPPAWMEGYNEQIPDGANRLFTVFEEQTRHRMHLEKTVVEGNVRHAKAGLYCGTGSILAAVIVAGILIFNDHDWAGVALGTAAFTALGAAYVSGSLKEKSERSEKAQRATQRKSQQD